MSDKRYTIILCDNQTGETHTLHSEGVIAYAAGKPAKGFGMEGIIGAQSGGGLMVVGRLCGADMLALLSQLTESLDKTLHFRDAMRAVLDGLVSCTTIKKTLEADPHE